MFTEVCPMPKPPMQIFEWEEPEIPRPQPKIQSQDFVQTIELPVLNVSNNLTVTIKQFCECPT